MTRADLIRLTVSVALGIILGVLIGDVTLGLAIVAVVYIFWIHRKLSTLLKWVRNRKENEPPDSRGVFEEISLEVDHLRQRHKKRKKKLGNYLKQFRQATRALPDATIVLDDAGAVKWANKASRKVLGIRWPEDNHQRIINLIRNPELISFFANKGRDSNSIDITGPLNKEQHLNVRLAPYGRGQWLFVARDVTQLHNADQIRRDFVANVSHELRTPLTVMRGYLETLSGKDEIPREIWKPALEQMTAHTHRMQGLVEDLLLLSRLERDPDLDDTVPVAVSELIADIHQNTALTDLGRDKLFSLEVDPELKILGSLKELHAAFSNLIFNALNYTDPRDVIEIKWYRDETGAHFSIKDNGIGIAEEHIARLTERFYRVDAARDRSQGGTGLGLAIVKHVLSRHGGSLHIESELGKGSLFRCDFPETIIVEQSAAMASDSA